LPDELSKLRIVLDDVGVTDELFVVALFILLFVKLNVGNGASLLLYL
jgi:hypothetical protein